jgi:pyroglutamyl-peptidase
VLRILVTGFEPFGGQSLNPSWEVAHALNGLALEGAQVVSVQLPCVFAQALPVLQLTLAQHRPDIVLALGQAEGRCDFSVERVAINVMDARIADNAGAQPIDVPAVAGAPAAYFSTLPIKALVAGLRAGGFPASVSQTAGTFVCSTRWRGKACTAALCICRCCPNKPRTGRAPPCPAGPPNFKLRRRSTPSKYWWRIGSRAWAMWP